LARVVLLGTAAAVPTPGHALTSLAVEGEGGFLLVDCGESPIPRLTLARLRPSDLRLLGRMEPLPVFGLHDVLERLRRMMDLFRWERWEGLYPVRPVAVSAQPGAVVLEDLSLRISATPVEHLVPTLGLRFENLRTGRAVAYSADTAPSRAVADLAQGAEVLFHEAAGASRGHSSPAQAGAVARQAGVDRLVLVHYPPDRAFPDSWVSRARAAFGGPVELGRDLQVFLF
jgi:ribonuclease Z